MEDMDPTRLVPQSHAVVSLPSFNYKIPRGTKSIGPWLKGHSCRLEVAPSLVTGVRALCVGTQQTPSPPPMKLKASYHLKGPQIFSAGRLLVGANHFEIRSELKS